MWAVMYLFLQSSECSTASQSQSFYVTDNPPAIGIIYKNEPKGDFSIELESLVEADANTGYLAYVTRAADGKRKLVLSIPFPLNIFGLVFSFLSCAWLVTLPLQPMLFLHGFCINKIPVHEATE